ncbi:hypothetical protein ACV229_02950 [Burkholderia sp. MR1-5-21]
MIQPYHPHSPLPLAGLTVVAAVLTATQARARCDSGRFARAPALGQHPVAIRAERATARGEVAA